MLSKVIFNQCTANVPVTAFIFIKSSKKQKVVTTGKLQVVISTHFFFTWDHFNFLSLGNLHHKA